MKIISKTIGVLLVLIGAVLGIGAFGVFILITAVYTSATLVLCLPVAVVLLGLMLLGYSE